MTNDIDALIERSRPALRETDRAEALARELTADLVGRGRRRPRRRLAAAILATVLGALSLGTGAAFAVPLLQQWWLWEPAADLTVTTEPFLHDGETLTCDIVMSVVTDGQTAEDDAVDRLRAARSFLGTISLDDYAEDARRLLEGELSAFPHEWAHEGFALQRAISDDFRDRGLLGAGVSLESSLACDPS